MVSLARLDELRGMVRGFARYHRREVEKLVAEIGISLGLNAQERAILWREASNTLSRKGDNDG